MADEETTTTEEAATPKGKPEAGGLEARFIRLSGYKEKDILLISQARKTVVTSNGGKYAFTKSGLQTLSGPPYPKEEVEEE